MSGYKRLISYIYAYEGKKKGKNTGFARIETKENNLRLSASVKNVYIEGNDIGVYLVDREHKELFLGNLFVRNGYGDYQTVLQTDNVDGSGTSMEMYCGLSIHGKGDSWRSYQTFWEDPVEQRAEEILPSSAQVSGEEKAAEAVRELREEFPEEEEIVAAEAAGTEEVCEQDEQPGSPELEDPELLKYLQESEEAGCDPEEIFAEFRKDYPKIQPFEYDDGCEILTIRPQDIGRLPRELWYYGNNSFLLHGYYNFRYLILVRLGNRKGKPRYLLGVPGHYYSNEKYMASMFGFPNFVLSRKQPAEDGRFGYWYTDIRLGHGQ